MLNFIFSCITFIRNLIFLPFRLLRLLFTYLKDMGCHGSKLDDIIHMEDMVDDWIEFIKALRRVLTIYIKMKHDTSRITREDDQQLFRSTVHLLSKIDVLTKNMKQFTTNIFSTQPSAARIFHDQADPLHKLQQENTRLIKENEFLIKENSKINNNIKDCQEHVSFLKQSRDNEYKEKDDLWKENRKLRNEVETLQNENRILRDKQESQIGNRFLDVSHSEGAVDLYVTEALAKLEAVRNDINKLRIEVDDYKGTKEDKHFLHLRELLLRHIVKLDSIETEGHVVIREKRREVIRFAQETLECLKLKVNM